MSTAITTADTQQDLQAMHDDLATLTREVQRVIVGQDKVIRSVVTCLLAGGHGLLEGVPGLGKTLLIRTLAGAVHLDFNRIQFTPDLMPADIVGTSMLLQTEGDAGGRPVLEYQPGPIFANIVLADEINRAPAKVQAALLEAMQEKQVTIGGTSFILEEPFLVLATQNPIEQEGTYPLPEAQVDRFMLKLRVGYPTRDEEREIMKRMAGGEKIEVKAVAGPEELMAARREIAALFLDPRLGDYIVDLIHATRAPKDAGLADLAPLVEYGASPRATIALAQASRAHAYLRGRDFVSPDDVKAMAVDVLRHRVLLSYEAEAENVTSDEVIGRILSAVPAP